MIPKTLIYCFGMAADFGGKPWGLSHYVCLRSAIDRIRPDRVLFFYEYEPTGPWWEITRPLVDLVKVAAPRQIFGNPIDHPAHRADIVRLEKLIELGGIYLDSDVFVHRSFDDLLSYPVVLGAEGEHRSVGVANAVIPAQAGAMFLRRWHETYRSFRGTGGKHWNEHSVLVPSNLARTYPGEVKVLSARAFYWPLWTAAHLEMIFNGSAPIVSDETYATHLWEGRSWRYVRSLTPRDVRRIETNFHSWARPYVDDLPDDFGGTHVPWRTRAPGRFELLSSRAINALQVMRAQRTTRTLAREN